MRTWRTYWTTRPTTGCEPRRAACSLRTSTSASSTGPSGRCASSSSSPSDRCSCCAASSPTAAPPPAPRRRRAASHCHSNRIILDAGWGMAAPGGWPRLCAPFIQPVATRLASTAVCAHRLHASTSVLSVYCNPLCMSQHSSNYQDMMKQRDTLLLTES